MKSEIYIHQEVLFGIIDHHKRNFFQNPFNQSSIAGCILGMVDDHHMRFLKCFELPWTEGDSSNVDLDYLRTKVELEKQVNGEMDILAFYFTKIELNLEDKETQKLSSVLSEVYNAPYALILDLSQSFKAGQSPPIKLFERSMAENRITEVKYSLEADKMEIICINDILNAQNGAQSNISGFASGMKNWVNSFDKYIQKLEMAIALLKSPDVMKDTDKLRQINEVIINLPNDFAEEGAISFERKLATTNVMNLLTIALKRITSIELPKQGEKE